MKKISLFLVSFLIISNFIVAQKRSLGQFTHDIPGIFSVMLSGVGPAYLFGDVGGRIEDQIFLGSTDWDMTKTRFLYSIGFRQRLQAPTKAPQIQRVATHLRRTSPKSLYKANTLCTEDPTPVAAPQILCIFLQEQVYSVINQNLLEMVDHALSTL